MPNPNSPFSGLSLCARFAFPPNKLQYCGGKKFQDVYQCTYNQKENDSLIFLFKEFETLYPYLKLIANNNNITSPFCRSVVEAYWLGNNLLEKINVKNTFRHFTDELKLKKKMPFGIFSKFIDVLPPRTIPHHNFHVFNIWLRVGNLPVSQTVKTMDECRISWGKIVEILPTKLIVLSAPLLEDAGQLKLAKSQKKEILYQYLSQGYLKPKLNDWVAIHWGWACEIISSIQQKNLEKYTQYALDIANRHH